MMASTLEQLQELYARIKSDPSYRNETMGTVFVPGEGRPDIRVVLVGEAPGREEEKEGSPFVGSAGQNLNALLRTIHWSREQLFITNLLKYRPVNANGENRKPGLRESRKALPYLLEELRILEPELVVCLGGSAAAALLQTPALKLAKANGVEFKKHGFRIFVTYHPSPFNYYNPKKREALEQAFARLREIVNGPRPHQEGSDA